MTKTHSTSHVNVTMDIVIYHLNFFFTSFQPLKWCSKICCLPVAECPVFSLNGTWIAYIERGLVHSCSLPQISLPHLHESCQIEPVASFPVRVVISCDSWWGAFQSQRLKIKAHTHVLCFPLSKRASEHDVFPISIHDVLSHCLCNMHTTLLCWYAHYTRSHWDYMRVQSCISSEVRPAAISTSLPLCEWFRAVD